MDEPPIDLDGGEETLRRRVGRHLAGRRRRNSTAREGEIFTYENSGSDSGLHPGHFHSPSLRLAGTPSVNFYAKPLRPARASRDTKFEPLYLDLLRSGSTKDVGGTCSLHFRTSTRPQRSFLERWHHRKPGSIDRRSGTIVAIHGRNLKKNSQAPWKRGLAAHADGWFSDKTRKKAPYSFLSIPRAKRGILSLAPSALKEEGRAFPLATLGMNKNKLPFSAARWWSKNRHCQGFYGSCVYATYKTFRLDLLGAVL